MSVNSEYYAAQHVIRVRKAHKAMIAALKEGNYVDHWRHIKEAARAMAVIEAAYGTSAELAQHGLFEDAQLVLWPPKKKPSKTPKTAALSIAA
jgi:hypothetical protein